MLSVAAAASAVAGTLGAVPAVAGDAPTPTTAMSRCEQNTTPDVGTTLHLAGGRGTRFPADGQQIRPGDVIRIIPRGEVSATGPFGQAADGSNWVSPAGVLPRQPASAGYPAPGLNKWSLVSRFGAFSPHEVMQRQRCMQFGAFGTLDLRINDNEDWDNFGAWDLDISLYRNPVLDSGFEQQTGQTVSWPWFAEGNAPKIVSTEVDEAHSGSRHIVLSNGGNGWNAVLQTIPVKPNTEYEVIGFVKTTSGINTAFFGARLSGEWPPQEVHFGPAVNGYQRLAKRFNSWNRTSATIFAGFWGVGSPQVMQIDDISVLSR